MYFNIPFLNPNYVFIPAAFKIIKSWLPEKALLIIKFIKKGGIDEYVPLDQALTCWGGNNDYTFTFVPENQENGEIVQNVPSTNRKVRMYSSLSLTNSVYCVGGGRIYLN